MPKACASAFARSQLPTTREVLEFTACYAAAIALSFALTIAFGYLGLAHAYDESSPRGQWFKAQEMTPAARERLSTPWKSCCDQGDVYHTRFRLMEDGSKYGAETYEYMKDGRWHLIPADIIQVKPTPDGRPVLFVDSSGREVCFIIDREGI